MSDKMLGAICDTEIEFLARTLIAQHGEAAPLAAERHLDELLEADSPRCDTWVAVIDAIHIIRCRDHTGNASGTPARAWQYLFRG